MLSYVNLEIGVFMVKRMKKNFERMSKYVAQVRTGR